MLHQFQCLTTKTNPIELEASFQQPPESFTFLTVDLDRRKQTASADFVLGAVTELKMPPVSTYLHLLGGCESFPMWRNQLAFKHLTNKFTLLSDPGHKSPSHRFPPDCLKQNSREESPCAAGVSSQGRVAEGSSPSLRGELGVAGRREASTQVLEDVKRQAAHQRDDGHLPQERYCGDEVHVWAGEQSRNRERIRRTQLCVRDYRQNDVNVVNIKGLLPKHAHGYFSIKAKGLSK